MALWLPACTADGPVDQGPLDPPAYSVVAVYPHDVTAFTQGLLVGAPGELLESTGIYGKSTVRRVDLQSGVPEHTVSLPSNRFGEGLARFEGRLYQLTWLSQVAYVYDEASLDLVDSIGYEGQGWGLTSDDTTLIMSNGSDTLLVVEPATFAVLRRVPVRDIAGRPVRNLNELEHAGGEIFANVWQTDWILRIDLASGAVREVLDLSLLLPEFSAAVTNENVLNGIAIDPATGHLLVTGKRWPHLFELRLDHPPLDPGGS